ncbi:hypothetical protein NQ314_009644 [Rhamnusium bicolor]|uniref:Uncharacterized protein n=1 Tax=Rhamnusium bicolor TaxID=1586634 RepID=A0AAV8XY68_9CUCU|nr:hypothetical protein NQ314_009644 [Rhamnusium bicolor]
MILKVFLESMILEKLRLLRDSTNSETHDSSCSSDDDKNEDTNKKSIPKENITGRNRNRSDTFSNNSYSEVIHPQKVFYHDGDNEEYVYKPKIFGLVKSDGTKIELNKQSCNIKKDDKPKVEAIIKSDRKKC